MGFSKSITIYFFCYACYSPCVTPFMGGRVKTIHRKVS
jgi:hypothetical protein